VYAKTLGILILANVVWTGITVTGCSEQERRFEKLRTDFSNLFVRNPRSPTSKPADGSQPRQSFINSFDVWILDSTGSSECLEEAWSHLDELFLPGNVEDWKVLSRNGLRCGKGQLSAWPTVKEQLDRCNTTTGPAIELDVGLFTPVVLLTDPWKPDRTIFYYDRAGRPRGEDFQRSKLQLVLTTAGRTGAGRIRVIFAPRVVKRISSLERLAPRRRPRRPGEGKTIQQELENLNITVDLGPDEFAVLGPASGKLAKMLVGSQLFLRWEKGQQHSKLILIKPVVLQGSSPKTGT